MQLAAAAARSWTCRSPTPPPGRASRPRLDREATRPTRPAPCRLARPKHAAADRELLHEVGRPRASASSRAVVGGRRRSCRTSPSTRPSAASIASSRSSAKWHADVVTRRRPTCSSGSLGARTRRQIGERRSAGGTRSPAAGEISDGGWPSIGTSRSVAGCRRGAAATRAGRACTGGAGRRRSRRRCPISTWRPAYITITRSAMPATTPRSWVISMIAESVRVLDLARARRAPAPGSSRRARWSARRR